MGYLDGLLQVKPNLEVLRGGTPVTPIRPKMNFKGSGVGVADNGSLGATDVEIAGVGAITYDDPLQSSGTTTPTVSIDAATTSARGTMSSADKTKLDAIGAGANVASIVASGSGLTVTGSASAGTAPARTAALDLTYVATPDEGGHAGFMSHQQALDLATLVAAGGLTLTGAPLTTPLLLDGHYLSTDSGSSVLVLSLAPTGHADSAEWVIFIPGGQRTALIVADDLNAIGDYAIDVDTGSVLDFAADEDHVIFITREASRNVTSIRRIGSVDTTPPEVVSVTATADDPDALVVLHDKPVDPYSMTGLSLDFHSGTARTLVGVMSGAGTETVTFSLSGNLDGTEDFDYVVGSGRLIQGLNGPKVATSTTHADLDFAPPDPFEILGSDLALWLRGDAGLSSGAWVDQGPDGNDFTGEHSPGASTMGPNSIACPTFDGVNQDYVTGAWPTSWTSAEGFIVFQSTHDVPDNSPSTDIGGLWYFGAGSPVVVPYTDGKVYETFGSTVNKATITGWTTNSDDQVTLYNARSAAGAFSLYQNGTQFYTTASNTVGMGVTAWIGSGGSGSYMFSGKIGEVIIAKRVLTGGERIAIQLWLNSRWGTAT